MPFDYRSLLGEDGEDSPYRVKPAMYAEDTPPLDPADEAVKRYSEHAREPMPSQGMYEKYIGSRPEYGDYKKGGLFRGIGAALLGAFGQAGAGRELLHPGYRKSYEDWETQGKYLPAQARAADAGRTKELEAEKFNIIGDAKRKQAELAKIKAEADAKAKEAAAALAQHKQEVKEENDRKTQERQEAAAKRAEDAAARAEAREQRAEAEAKARESRTRIQDQSKLASHRVKVLEKEGEDIDTQVRDEITSNPQYKDYFTTDKKGQVIITPAGEAAGIRQLIDSEVRKRKDVRRTSVFGDQ